MSLLALGQVHAQLLQLLGEPGPKQKAMNPTCACISIHFLVYVYYVQILSNICMRKIHKIA